MPQLNGQPQYTAKIADYRWWEDNYYAVQKWLDENTELGAYSHVGKVIHFKHEHELIWFRLKWNK